MGSAVVICYIKPDVRTLEHLKIQILWVMTPYVVIIPCRRFQVSRGRNLYLDWTETRNIAERVACG